MLKKIILFNLITMLMYSCTCKKELSRWDIDKSVFFRATLSDTNKVLQLGDTIKLSITLGDTLYTEQNDTIAIKSIQEANVIFPFRKLIVKEKDTGLSSIFEKFVEINGSRKSNGITYFNTSKKPISFTIGFVPQEKGIYSISQESYQGQFFINDNVKARTEAYFDVKDAHTELMLPYFKESIKQGIDDLNSVRGVRHYYFKVE